jgi:hypothetical protein
MHESRLLLKSNGVQANATGQATMRGGAFCEA